MSFTYQNELNAEKLFLVFKPNNSNYIIGDQLRYFHSEARCILLCLPSKTKVFIGAETRKCA